MAGPVLSTLQYLKLATTPTPTSSIGELISNEFTQNANMIDVTVAGDGFADYLPAILEGVHKVKVWRDPSDSVQSALRAAFLARTLLYFDYSPDGGTDHYTGTLYVKQWKETSDVKTAVALELDLQVTGSWTPA